MSDTIRIIEQVASTVRVVAVGPQGPQGEQGPEGPPGSGGGASTFLGLTDTPDSYAGQTGRGVRVKLDGTGLDFVTLSPIISWEGTWQTGFTYLKDQLVFHDGSAWICTSTHLSEPDNQPGSGSEIVWDLFAQEGAQGVPGSTGATGPQGPQGDTGPAGTTNHSLLTNLSADDHTQYARADGTRWTTTMTANRVVVSSGAGALIVSSITTTQLGHLNGVTSAIQTQLDGKAATSHTHAASDITSGTIATARLGSGTADGTTFLAGDQSYKAIAHSVLTGLTTGDPHTQYVTVSPASGTRNEITGANQNATILTLKRGSGGVASASVLFAVTDNAGTGYYFRVGFDDEFGTSNIYLGMPTNLTNRNPLRFYEPTGAGTNFVAFRAPATLAGDLTFDWPNAYGTSGHYLQTDGAGGLTWAAAAAPVKATIPYLNAQQGVPPASSNAAFDFVIGTSSPPENFPVVSFGPTTDEFIDFYLQLPANYSGGGLTLTLHHGAATATTGTAVMGAAIRRLNDSSEDLDTTAHTYDYNNVNMTPPGTLGQKKTTNITFTSGTDMDDLAAGELFVLRIRRDADNGSDDMANGFLLHGITLGET